MKRILLVLFLFLSLILNPLSLGHAFAQTPAKDTFFQGSITSISPTTKTLVVRLDNNKSVPVTYEPQSSGDIHPGDTVVIGASMKVATGNTQYYFVDQSRTTPLLFVVIGFFIFLLCIVGWRGIGSIAGLLISLGVIFLYILPQIITGSDPLTVCMIGAVAILFVTTLVAHGVSQQTITALIGTLIALLATYFMAQLVAHIALLTGYGNEEAVNVSFALPHMLSLKGLYLGGIILATLGALNDITITQATTIFSLRKANPSLTFKDLATEGYGIGREHALSLVNTLLLAFAGTSLALFIFLVANPNSQPLWVILNSESLVEEIIQIIAGTAGLLLAVPLVTILAALVNDRGVRETVKGMFQ